MKNETAIISRICHDLIAPFNAISLGFEAFEVSRDDSLIAEMKKSIDKANATLEYMRELFSDKAQTSICNVSSLNRRIIEYLKFHNISFKLTADMEDVSYTTERIIMYAAIISKEVLPFGGIVSAQIADKENEISVRCLGQDANLPNMIFNEELNYRNVIKRNFLTFTKESRIRLETYSDGQYIVFSIKK